MNRNDTLVTGCAGFIGFHLCQRLLSENADVWGLDNLNSYYDVNLKEARLERLTVHPRFRFVRLDLTDRENIARLFREHRFDVVVNLAAQPGVRHSVAEPYAYIDSNVVGFANVLEGCRRSGIKHLVFASSSSIYGANTQMPFATCQNTDHPLSLYAATKKADELMAHAYAHLYSIPCTGLRFFTVYGPWGRPDMALHLFTRAILAGDPIPVFNLGKMRRDFTYVEDIVEGMVRVIARVPQPSPDWESKRPNPAISFAPYRIYNLGNDNPVDLMVLLELLQIKLGKQGKFDLLPLQPGDVPATWADVDYQAQDVGFRPSTPIEVGVARFVDWYRAYYRV